MHLSCTLTLHTHTHTQLSRFAKRQVLFMRCCKTVHKEIIIPPSYFSSLENVILITRVEWTTLLFSHVCNEIMTGTL